MEAALPTRRSNDQHFIDQLASRWDGTDVRLAAWRDLIEVCRDPTVPLDTVALCRDLFWQMVRAGDHDTGQLSDFLAGTLADCALFVDLAKAWLGDITDDGNPLRRLEPAGLSVDEQLSFCERLVTEQATPGRYVVWIAYGHAGPGFINRELGPISFWSGAWLRAAVVEGQGPSWELVPSELKGKDGLFQPEDLPEDDHVLLARADLGRGAWTNPVRVATEQIESVVALASFHVGDTQWRPMAGYLVAVDNRVMGIGSFHPIVGRDELPNYPYQRAMDAELDDLSQQLAPHLPIPDGSLLETIQAVRRWQQARRQSPRAAVLQHVQVVELIAHQVGAKNWYTYLDEYQRAQWVRHHLIHELGRIIDDCMHNVSRLPSVADRQWLQELDRATTTYRPGGTFRRDLGKASNELPKLAQLFPPSDELGRRVQDAVQRYTRHELPRWRNDLEDDWQLVRNRVVRVRNALEHGGPLMDDTVVTVHKFMEQLAQWSLEVTLEGLLGGQDVAAANAAHKQECDRWSDGLASAATVIDALTG